MFRRLFICLALLAVPAASLQAQWNEVLGPDHQVVTVRPGSSFEIAELEGEPESPILLLEISHPDGTASKILVPSTDGEAREGSPTLVFETDTGRLYVLWKADHSLHSVLNLAWWDGETWSESVELSGNSLSIKLDPRITVTRDTATGLSPDGEIQTIDRTIVHVVWSEPESDETAFYSPVVFAEGEYIGWNPVFLLDDLAYGGSDPSDSEEVRILSPVIRPGTSPSSIVIGFVNDLGGSVSSLKIDVMPDDLVSIGEQARSHILEVGMNFLPGNGVGLAVEARSHILEVGIGLSGPARRLLANETMDLLIGIGDSETTDDLNFLGDQARSHILEVGGGAFGSGITNHQPNRRVEIDLGEGISHPLILSIRNIRKLPAPPDGPESFRLLLSANGSCFVAAWQGDESGDLFFVENFGKYSWGEPSSLNINEDLSLEHALELLQNRIDAAH